MITLSIDQAIGQYLGSVQTARSANTARTYKNGLGIFRKCLESQNFSLSDSVHLVNENLIMLVISDLKENSATTERLYLTAISGFYEFLAAQGLAEINLPRLKLLIKQRARRPGQRLPQFPRDAIDQMLEFSESLLITPVEDENEKLRNLRDRAFLITLAETGLRVHEACNLRRGDLDWNNGQAIIIGKGNKQAVVRFSRHAQKVLRDYLQKRANLDGGSGKPLTALPLFARHDPGAGKKVKPITTTTGRNIVTDRVREALGEEYVGRITPHSFRHYFVTRILQVSNNLKLAQELARHSNIAVTQRYAHLADNELDQGYWNVFEENDKS